MCIITYSAWMCQLFIHQTVIWRESKNCFSLLISNLAQSFIPSNFCYLFENLCKLFKINYYYSETDYTKKILESSVKLSLSQLKSPCKFPEKFKFIWKLENSLKVIYESSFSRKNFNVTVNVNVILILLILRISFPIYVYLYSDLPAWEMRISSIIPFIWRFCTN